ncbi:unnamed protein product [Prorocentrum cordatum]|uniref:Uncharacterized protein n=1 Tax=Prorocentrum cordatum TaxID=2364126 RepID=A0ABN9RXE0_9DINO|nr:unnamed protein product [Polarella glacialis]
MVGVCKKPASAPLQPLPGYAGTHLTNWVCGGNPTWFRNAPALVVALNGVSDITHGIKRCQHYRYRTMYMCNLYAAAHGHVNTCGVSDLRGGILFVSAGRAFALKFLEYHGCLLFRGFPPSWSASWSCKQQLNDAMCMQEFEPIGQHLNIAIGGDLCDGVLAKHIAHFHESVMWEDTHTHGLFMVVDPASQDIVAVSEQVQPENNEVLNKALDMVLPLYPRCNALIMDRACSFMPSAQKRCDFDQLKYCSVDKFHARGHAATCPCNPLKALRLKRRVNTINTAAAEQLFSWFRVYARTLNEMRRSRHKFSAMYFCRKRNELVDARGTDHLKKHKLIAPKKQKKGKYPCSPKIAKKPAVMKKARKR